jgi:glycosyltransferase involved in cell wall biosynthesis
VKVGVCGITPSSVHFRTYVEFLVERGHEVTVLTNDYQMPVEIDLGSAQGSLKVVNFARHTRLVKWLPRGLRLIPRVVKLRRALRAGDFDVLDVMQVTPDGVYAALMWHGPLVLDFWGSDIMRLDIRPWWVRRLMPRAIRKASMIHSVSDDMTDRLLSYGADRDRVETFQYGIDLGRFRFEPAPHRAGRVVHTRGLRPFYRSDVLIRALPLVRETRPDVTLALTGGTDEMADLKAVAAEAGVAEEAEFLGFVTDDEVAAELRSASVWVSIPPTDGTPLSLLEAMGSGALPVVSDLPTVRDWIDEDRGVFAKEITPEGVAAALLRGLALSETAHYAEPNRRIVEERGDRNINLPRWEGLLQRAAAG